MEPRRSPRLHQSPAAATLAVRDLRVVVSKKPRLEVPTPAPELVRETFEDETRLDEEQDDSAAESDWVKGDEELEFLPRQVDWASDGAVLLSGPLDSQTLEMPIGDDFFELPTGEHHLLPFGVQQQTEDHDQSPAPPPPPPPSADELELPRLLSSMYKFMLQNAQLRQSGLMLFQAYAELADSFPPWQRLQLPVGALALRDLFFATIVTLAGKAARWCTDDDQAKEAWQPYIADVLNASRKPMIVAKRLLKRHGELSNGTFKVPTIQRIYDAALDWAHRAGTPQEADAIRAKLNDALAIRCYKYLYPIVRVYVEAIFNPSLKFDDCGNHVKDWFNKMFKVLRFQTKMGYYRIQVRDEFDNMSIGGFLRQRGWSPEYRLALSNWETLKLCVPPVRRSV